MAGERVSSEIRASRSGLWLRWKHHDAGVWIQEKGGYVSKIGPEQFGDLLCRAITNG
jgi:hypothetical protein